MGNLWIITNITRWHYLISISGSLDISIIIYNRLYSLVIRNDINFWFFIRIIFTFLISFSIIFFFIISFSISFLFIISFCITFFFIICFCTFFLITFFFNTKFYRKVILKTLFFLFHVFVRMNTRTKQNNTIYNLLHF